MASETVDPVHWLHPPPYTGQYSLSSTYCTLQWCARLQITKLAALSQLRTCDLRNARPTHCLCGQSGYKNIWTLPYSYTRQWADRLLISLSTWKITYHKSLNSRYTNEKFRLMQDSSWQLQINIGITEELEILILYRVNIQKFKYLCQWMKPWNILYLLFYT